MAEQIQVIGLAQLNKSLGRLDKEAPKALRVALNSAAELLIQRTIPKIPRRSGAAAKSLKVASTRTSARVSVGGRRAPYYPWLDFGGKTGRKKATTRPFYKQGRYLFPTLGRIRPEIESELSKALTDVVQKSGLDVS